MGSPSVTATTTPGPNTGVSPLSTETVSVDPLTGLFSPAAAAGIVTSNPTTGAVSAGGVTIVVPTVVAQQNVPVILPSSATINSSTGAITGLTSFSNYYTQGCWMYFPAGATLPSGAGWYFVKMSSATAGTVYTNFNSAAEGTVWTPTIPTTLVAATGGAAYTQTVGSFIYGPTYVVPAKLMGQNGQLILNDAFEQPNNANGKYYQLLINSSPTSYLSNLGLASTSGALYRTSFNNAGSYTYQTNNSYGGSTNVEAYGNYADTSVNWTLTRALQISTATDNLIHTNHSAVVQPFGPF